MRILVITGAGVSAESGIPTFRGRDGYWQKLDPAKLATPEAFAHDPTLVWDWYRERRQRIRLAQPNPAHQAIVKLAAHAGEFLLVTQNVDDLHLRAKSEGRQLSQERLSRFTEISLLPSVRVAFFNFTRQVGAAHLDRPPQTTKSGTKRMTIFRDAQSAVN